MGYGLIAVTVVGLFLAYVVVQETRARLHWRGLVRRGDLPAIQTLVEEQIGAWRSAKVPKGTPATLWHCVQTTEIASITAEALHVICSAEGVYALEGGAKREISSALQEGIRVTARLAEMLLYEILEVKMARVRIDVYSTFRGDDGTATQRCILSTDFERDAAAALDWDTATPEEIVSALGGRYEVNERGAAVPIDVEAPPRDVPAPAGS